MRNSLLAILTATFATLCCTGPILLASLGATSLASFAWVGPFRPYLSIGAVGLIGWAFWRSYRPQAKAACCTVDQRAALIRQRRVLLAVVPTIVLLLAFPYFLGTSLAGGEVDSTAIQPGNAKSTWAITGMTCAGCATGLEASLAAESGMLACEVSFDERQMGCVTDGNKLKEANIPSLVSQYGFKARRTDTARQAGPDRS